ncbi:helix-turn-helix transcriptional regulator [Gloeomargarita lithophora]|uniref:helix-turn-helix transcriptional regulator n=1 Tax=Gloeomargarita lithophora TaxID=1188228 RepID=UPI0012FE28C9|nr:hypothetical protein [Gloeomargarita lithophora]
MLKGFKRASEVAGVSVSTLKVWQREGKFPAGLLTKISARTVFFNEQILRQWLSGELPTQHQEKRTAGRPRKVRHFGGDPTAKNNP